MSYGAATPPHAISLFDEVRAAVQQDFGSRSPQPSLISTRVVVLAKLWTVFSQLQSKKLLMISEVSADDMLLTPWRPTWMQTSADCSCSDDGGEDGGGESLETTRQETMAPTATTPA